MPIATMIYKAVTMPIAIMIYKAVTMPIAIMIYKGCGHHANSHNDL